MAHGRGRSSSFLGASCVLAVSVMVLLFMFRSSDTGLMAENAFVGAGRINRLRCTGIRRLADDAEEDLEVDDGGDVPDPQWKEGKKCFLRAFLLENRYTYGRESYDWHKAKDEYLLNAPEEERKEILTQSIPLPLSGEGEEQDEDRVTTKIDGVFRFKPEKFHLFEGERLTEMVDGRFRFVAA
eukprot:TRINITY_DN62710_c0_g1_i1.p1 TRINITY_DN62710_c0_g1~~TRINITY_DN62710_c0_g1_i1.p1  ORF type:complete len:207 (-),score=40.90 TRINITY_DN62710_c0_g1_i1:233-781(-)